jgi:ligand-binding sensor domain-containing protein
MTKAVYIFFLLQCIAWQKTFPQDATINFHKLDINSGLHDGTVRCIGQDKFGYMWVGTVGALNRFDGKAVKHFTNIPGDTSSVYSSQPRSILSDENGRLWIGFETGLVEFNFSNTTFKRIPLFKDLFVGKIISRRGNVLYLTTNAGLFSYNINTNEAFNYSTSRLPQHAALLNNAVSDVKLKNDTLFLATAKEWCY